VGQINKGNLKIWTLTMTAAFPIWPVSQTAVTNGRYIKGLVWTNTRKLRMAVFTTPTVCLRYIRFVSLA